MRRGLAAPCKAVGMEDEEEEGEEAATKMLKDPLFSFPAVNKATDKRLGKQELYLWQQRST